MPFWQPRRLGSAARISVKRVSSAVTALLFATNSPVRDSVEQNSAVGGGPEITKPWIVRFVAPLTRMMSPGSVMPAGALMVAARDSVEVSVRPSLLDGIVSCSAYVPGQTSMFVPLAAAVTAAPIVLAAGAFTSSQSPGAASPSSSTMVGGGGGGGGDGTHAARAPAPSTRATSPANRFRSRSRIERTSLPRSPLPSLLLSELHGSGISCSEARGSRSVRIVSTTPAATPGGRRMGAGYSPRDGATPGPRPQPRHGAGPGHRGGGPGGRPLDGPGGQGGGRP